MQLKVVIEYSDLVRSPAAAEMDRPGSGDRNRREEGAEGQVLLPRGSVDPHHALAACPQAKPPLPPAQLPTRLPPAPPLTPALHHVQAPAAPSPLVLVSSAKGEARSLRAGYKALARHLKAARCEVRRLDRAPLTPAALDGAAIVVFGAPTQPFAAEELEALRSYLRGGGNLLVLAAEGGADAGAGAAASAARDVPGASGTAGRASNGGSFDTSNLGSLLKEFGLGVGVDCVIQTAFTKWVLPPLAGQACGGLGF